MRGVRNQFVVVGVVLAGAVLAGCSAADVGTAGASEVASAAASALKSETGQDAQVDCGSATLKLEVGQSIECSVRIGDDGVDRSAQVRVASVSEDGYTVDVGLNPSLVSDMPVVSADEVRTLAANTLKTQVKADPSVTCKHELARVVGSSTTCETTFTGENESRTAEMVVKSLNGAGAPEVEVSLSPTVEDKPLSDSRDSVAGVVASALEDQLGEKPKVDCGGGFVVLKDGQDLTCAVSSASDESLGEARVKLRDVTGASYAVDVALNQPVIEEKN